MNIQFGVTHRTSVEVLYSPPTVSFEGNYYKINSCIINENL